MSCWIPCSCSVEMFKLSVLLIDGAYVSAFIARPAKSLDLILPGPHHTYRSAWLQDYQYTHSPMNPMDAAPEMTHPQPLVNSLPPIERGAYPTAAIEFVSTAYLTL